MNQEIWNRTEWFRKERFGMFIHWGLYAIPALGEWVMSEKRMTVEEYEKYFEQFDPTDYNPREWARLAKKAGMKYAVLTAKHHDGTGSSASKTGIRTSMAASGRRKNE